MLEGLERIDWGRLTHAYGPAGEVPGWIRELTSDDAAVRKHLQSKNLMVAVITQDGAASLETLRSGKPTPVHYESPGTPPEILAEDKLIQKFPVAVNSPRSRVITPDDLFEH